MVPHILYYYRHDVRPGITGLAQINGRNYITWEETFAYDLEYINNITLMGDIKILLGTIGKVIKHEDVTDSVGSDSDTDSSGRHVHDALNIERGYKDVA